MQGAPPEESLDESGDAPGGTRGHRIRRLALPLIGACLLAGLTIGTVLNIQSVGEFLREFQRKKSQERLSEYVVLLKNHLAALRTMREAGVSQATWEQEAEQIRAAHKPILNEMEQTASRREPIRQHILWAVRDRFPEVLANGRLHLTASEVELASQLQEAEDRIQQSSVR